MADISRMRCTKKPLSEPLTPIKALISESYKNIISKKWGMKMKKMMGIMLATLLLLTACGSGGATTETESSESNASSISTTEESSSEKKEIILNFDSEEVTTDAEGHAVIKGVTNPDADVAIGLGFIGDSTTADSNGNFELSYDLGGTDETTITVNAKVDGEKASKDLLVKPSQEFLDKKKKEAEEEAKAKEEAEAKKKAEEEQAAKEQAEKEAAEKAQAEKDKQLSEAPREHQNALRTAYDYLDYSAFSKTGLYDQLIFEEYPAEAAQFAIDNVETDWNANALQAAKDYLDYSAFSNQGLYDQLLFEGYTAEQAQFAIDNLPN